MAPPSPQTKLSDQLAMIQKELGLRTREGGQKQQKKDEEAEEEAEGK